MRRLMHWLAHLFGTNAADCAYRTGKDGQTYFYLWCRTCGRGTRPPDVSEGADA